MVIKRFRIPLMLLIVAMMLGTVAPMMATATATDPPAGFTGMYAVNLAVNSEYAWHTMTDDEAASYGLEAYKGTNVYIAGNSYIGKPDINTVSNLGITVSEPGELTFEYALSTYYDSGNSGVSAYFYLAYAVDNQITTGTTVGKTNVIQQGVALPDENGWEKFSISIGEDAFLNADSVTVYIAFHFGGRDATHFAAVRNVKFGSGNRDDVVRGYDTAMGTVSVEGAALNDLVVGSTYTLSAKANENYQFYGWVKHSADGSEEYQTLAGGKLSITVDSDSWYEPVFAKIGTYVLRKGATFYDSTASLKTAIEGAASGDVLVLLKDSTVAADITVPAGVTLYIPYRAAWEKEEAGYSDKYDTFFQYHLSTTDNNICHGAIAGEDETYVRLTVAEGSTLTVNGEVVIGAVIGYDTQRFQGHVSGVHGRITNNGRIVVGDGGILRCYGPVDGSKNGIVYVEDGGILKEMFVIGDFAGGNNSAELHFTSQMPFKRFSVQNVQCKLQMEAKAQLVAMANVWASSRYNEAEAVLYGDSNDAAFRPNSGLTNTVVLTREYNAGHALTDIVEGNNKGLLDVTGIGRTEWTFTSGLTFQPFMVRLGTIELNTAESDFTIPYNFKIRLVGGTYNMNVGMRIMPGAEVIVESGASVNIKGRLMVMDGLVQTDMSGDRYPKRKELTDKGFSGSGELTINGTLTMENGATLGGLIKSDGGGKLVIGENVYVNNTGTLSLLNQTKELAKQDGSWFPSDGGVAVFDSKGMVVKIEDWVQQDGAQGTYDENTTWFNLPARIYTAGGMTKVEAGKTYVAKALSSPETATYTADYLYVADGVYSKSGYATGSRVMTPATETLNRSVSAEWVDSAETEDTVEVAVTVAGSETTGTLTSNATVVFDTAKSGADTVLSNLTAIDATTKEAKTEKYVFLVKYTVEGSTTGTAVTPVEGVYTIPSEANGVTIEACLLGDISGDGIIIPYDAYLTFQAYANSEYKTSLSELSIMAADFDCNGTLIPYDAYLIFCHYAGK